MKNKRILIRYSALLVTLIGVMVLLFYPMNSFLEGPGDASEISKIVKIKNHPDKYNGKFLLTSVSLSRAHPLSYLIAKVNPVYTVEKADEIMSPGQDDDSYEKVQKYYMQSSINTAIYTAFKAANYKISTHYQGIYVLDIAKSSKFNSILKVGDVITKIDNHHFNNSLGYVNYINNLKKSQKVKIQFIRNNQIKTATGALTKLVNGNYGLGITLTDYFKIHPSVPVKVNPGNVGGPSGGLMFTLQVYEQLTQKNIRKNRVIAGTGTINKDGQVGEIGGIDKKIIAAYKNGATVFLAPYVKPSKSVLKLEPDHKTNYQLAKETSSKYAPTMKVIPVTSFKDAINKLS